MASLTVAAKASQSTTLPALLVAFYANTFDPNKKITIDIRDVDKLDGGHAAELKNAGGASFSEPAHIISSLVAEYYPKQPKTEALIDEWLARLPKLSLTDYKAVEPQLLEIDSHLLMRSYIVGHKMTSADAALFGAIRGNRVAAAAIKRGTMLNLSRWYRFVEESNFWIEQAITQINAAAHERRAVQSRKGASYDIELKDTEKGVVTRFPPEPSGYLHIGHAKAALLNDYFAHDAYAGGTMICRFDDTNPTKEREEFQDAIVEDLALMGIRPDRTTYSSDYFREMYDYCVKMIKEGKAYADDTDRETMQHERMEGIASKRRDASPDANMTAFEQMKAGSEEGLRWCIRAKISVDNPNKAMRDPVIYRCNTTPHHRTGTAWKVYPTYDFCVPILDSIEGVTHALRTIEYRDRNPQYNWMQEAMGLRPVHIWDFARMNFVRTLLSKRKLTKFVDSNVVWGWDDPRFPTIRGIRRRGMTVGALREFILKQGPSRNIVNLDWTSFWTTNKKYIDPVAPRHTAVASDWIVECEVHGAREAPQIEQRPLHPKNPDVGTKKVAFSNRIYIEQEDAKSFKQDEEITLMSWGNAIVRKISHSLNPLHLSNVTKIEMELHLQGDFKITEKKITWLAKDGLEPVKVELVDFDFLITKDKLEEDDNAEDFLTPKTEFRVEALADANVADLKRDDIIQFERKGFYRVDSPVEHSRPAVLFYIPSGKEPSLVAASKPDKPAR